MSEITTYQVIVKDGRTTVGERQERRGWMKIGRWSLVAVVVCSVGVGCVSNADSEAKASESTLKHHLVSKPAFRHSGLTLDTVSLGPDHDLYFVEFQPGQTGWLETGPTGTSAPAVTREMASKGVVALFKQFRPGADVPEKLLAATPDFSNSTQPSGPFTDAGEEPSGPHTDNDGEQAWFRGEFCNGAQDCVQAWDWAHVVSQYRVKDPFGVAMVGAEGTQNARFSIDEWHAVIFGGWVEVWTALVVPGHWVSLSNPGTYNLWQQWRLDGAGANTQVSLAARYGRAS